MDGTLATRLQNHLKNQSCPEYTAIREQRNASRTVSVINRRLRENPKAVVSLGCSFVQGQAAWDQEALDILRPHGGGAVSDFNYSYKEHDLKDLLDFAEHFKLSMRVRDQNTQNRYNQCSGQYEVVTGELETKNAFVNKFAEHAGYVPINLGNLGNGNMSCISRLSTYPIDWHLCEEIIVIWCYTDLNRYDLVNDGCIDFENIGNDYKTLWPQYNNYDPDREKFHQGKDWHNTQYYLTLTAWSEAYSYLNFVTAGTQLKTWCQAHNAKLITLSAFAEVTKEQIENEFLHKQVFRDSNHNMVGEGNLDLYEERHNANQNSINLFPWESIYMPQGETSFFKLALAQELKYEDFDDYCKNKMGKTAQDVDMHDIVHYGGTPNDWIFPCGHPSAKAHELLATDLFNHYKSNMQ